MATAGEVRQKLIERRRKARDRSSDRLMKVYADDAMTELELHGDAFDDGWNDGYKAGFQAALDALMTTFPTAVRSLRSSINARGLAD